MKILFVWTGVTSYMADCWRELQRKPDVELKIVVEQVASGREFDASKVLHDLDYVLVDDAGSRNGEVAAFTPDIIFAVGWHSKVVRKLVTRPEWRNVPKICCFDLPWRWKPRCIAAKFVLAPFLRHYDAAYVPGLACARYAKWLGFKKIVKGLFAIDVGRFVTGGDRERKGFLYVGRFSDEKRIDLIERAYARYRELGGTWTIDYYGGGNFRGPDEMPGIYAEHACLVLASAFDPWPLVALEAKAAGCEVIQSDRCGNRLELDTRIVPYGDVAAMAREMLKVEAGAARGGARGELAEWDCATWAGRTLEICKELTA